MAAVWRRANGWNLEMFSIAERGWCMLTRDGTIEMQPRFARDGGSILYTSDHGGVYNLRRLDLASGRTTMLTNVTGGAFYPSESAAGMLYYIGYGPRGFDLFRVQPAALPLPAAPARSPAASEPVPAPVPATATVEKYTPWRGLQPRWWAPHLVVETDRTEVGAITAGTDAPYRHLYLVDAAYDFSVHSFVGRLDYNYDRWWPVFKLHAARDNDFERTNNDDVTRVRHSDNYIAEVMLPWLTIDTRFSLHAGMSVDKESDAKLFGNSTPQAPTNDARAGIAAVWDSTNRWPLSVTRTEGRELRVVVEDSSAFSGDFTGKIYTVDWREFIPLGGEHVLTLRFAEG